MQSDNSDGEGVKKNNTEQPESPEDAIKDYLATHKSGIGRLISGCFEIRTLQEAEKLSTMLANNYPVPERVSTGIWELISNSVEHGNLEINCEEKARLIRVGRYSEEIARRLALPHFASRVVTVHFKRLKTAVRLRVSDEGSGFDFTQYLNRELPLDAPNGRGILIAARFSFDNMIYRGRGNIVDAIVRTTEHGL